MTEQLFRRVHDSSLSTLPLLLSRRNPFATSLHKVYRCFLYASAGLPGSQGGF